MCIRDRFVDNPIQVEALCKSYGTLPAVKGIDFEVRAGEVFGLLGPNGAGKTTTVEILEGLRTRSGGRVSVLGCDPEVQTRQLKDRVGVCLQSTNLQEKLKSSFPAYPWPSAPTVTPNASSGWIRNSTMPT